ncbi:hypothetical protein LJC63_10485 [Ruminococcaceae bacterium OttesenSCG-928-L11]|nr:hypothetical protein [Ruminococcaceae bacterium OttesenSCG-928-L11]
MDKERFAQVCREYADSPAQKKGIGTLSEKTLHAVLKRYYDPFEQNHEIRIGSHVADIVGESGIIEIQTRAFDRLRGKLTQFLSVAPVTVVYPVAGVKWLSWMDPETGEIVSRRKSPRRGTAHDVFYELYKIKQFTTDPHLTLVIPILELEEIRYLNGWSRDKKRGSSRCERVPIALMEEIVLQKPSDYLALVPFSAADAFTTQDYAKACGISRNTAGTELHILHYLGALERVGKKGNFHLYRVADGSDACAE